jgi:D-glycero-D-manno-heptose 1,7-bisphosphate phosphatase
VRNTRARIVRRAVFRDGTVICDVRYPSNPQQARLLPGVGKALADLRKRGFLLVLVSNQSGRGRGLITFEEAKQVHRQLVSSPAAYNVEFKTAYYCPYVPQEGCHCRRPSPAMILRAAEELEHDLRRSFIVGDVPSDIEAGKLAGCRAILLATNATSREPDPFLSYV